MISSSADRLTLKRVLLFNSMLSAFISLSTAQVNDYQQKWRVQASYFVGDAKKKKQTTEK
jgi:hypothetical protein